MAVPPPGPVPKEALDFLRRKQIRPEFDHRDVWSELHANYFTVAKMMQADLLNDVQRSLATALEQGQTFRTWSKSIRPQLEKAGWWGVQAVDDPLMDERRLAQLGSPRRLKTIYRVNLRQARATGQWQRIQRTKKALPFLIYELGPSVEHRDDHVAWHGTILPVDDPWWDTHTPMNGWGCKCRIRQISARQRDRLIKEGVPDQGVPELDDNGLPTGRRIRGKLPAKTQAPPQQMREWRNERLGKTLRIPKGIDPGFETNSGAIYRTDRFAHTFTQKLTKLEPEIGAKAFELVRERVMPVVSREFRRFATPLLSQVEAVDRGSTKKIRDQKQALVIGSIKPGVAQWLSREFGVQLSSSALVIRDAEVVRLFRTSKRARGAAVAREDLLELPSIIDQPDEVIWDTGKRGDGRQEQPALLYVFKATDGVGKIIVRLNYQQQVRDESGRRSKPTVNFVRSSGIVQEADLKQSRYQHFSLK